MHQGILNDLSVSHAFLLTIFPTLFARDRKPPSLVSIVGLIRNDVRTKNEKSAEEVVRALRSCIVHNAEISTWFGGALGGINADKIVANVLRFKNDGGHFIGRTPKASGGSGLDLGCGGGLIASGGGSTSFDQNDLVLSAQPNTYFRINGVRLQEQVRAAVFVCGDLDSPDANGLTEAQHSALREFIAGHETAMQIVRIRFIILFVC